VIGERVRLAREACLLTQHDLSDLSGVPLGTIGAIENSRIASPSDDAIVKIARATGFPTSFFHLGDLPDMPEGHYRRLTKGTVKVGKQVRAQVRQIIELVQRSEGLLQLPPVQLEPVREVSDLEEIEKIAARARQWLGVGSRDPIPNVMRAVERAGVVVIRLPNEMPHHDGFSAWPDYGLNGRPIIALTGGHPGDRDRFNTAHELGHLLLHTLRPGIERAKAEKEAHRFAGALLLPREAAIAAMHPPITLRVLMGIKATFGTSIAMSAQRALDLNLITHHQFLSLRKQLSARRWLRAEPVEVSSEKPLLISKVVNILSGEGSTSERAARIAMPLFTFRAVAS
jgi:Zn-dependent peptidase ImmA (M78 family)/transcriptional regulator with XRE-family HTH domain